MGSKGGRQIGGRYDYCTTAGPNGGVWAASDDLNTPPSQAIVCDKCGTHFTATWNGDSGCYALCPNVNCHKQFPLIVS